MSKLLLIALAVLSIAWTNNPSPTLTRLPLSLLMAEAQYTTWLYTNQGAAHAAHGFWAPSHTKVCQIWDVNLSNGVSTLINCATGYPPIYGSVTISNELVIGTSDPGHLVTYDIINRTSVYLKACSDRDYYSQARVTNGNILLGCYGTVGSVEEYYPATKTVRVWGAVDPSPGGSVYVYYIGGNANYIYSVIRQGFGTNNWYLGITDRASSNSVLWWKDVAQAGIGMHRSTNGTTIFVNRTTNGVETWWALTNDTPAYVASVPAYQTRTEETGINIDPTNWDDVGWDIDFGGDISSIDGSTPTGTLSYRTNGAAAYSVVTETSGWLMSPATVRVFKRNPVRKTEYYTAIMGYGPLFSYDVALGSTAIIGPYKGQSTYDILPVARSEAYLAGYYLLTMRWNPSAEWTKTAGINYFSSSYNPYTVFQGGGLSHYYLARGSNGNIYVGSHWSRTGSGGEIGQINTTTWASNSLRTPFLLNDVQDLFTVEDGSKLMYLGAGGSNALVNLSLSLESNFVFGVTFSKGIEYERGKILAVATSNLVWFTTGGTLLYSNNLPASTWAGYSNDRKRLSLAPNGNVFISSGGYTYEIYPNGTYSSQLIRTTNDYNLTWSDDGKAYFYGANSNVWMSQLLINPHFALVGPGRFRKTVSR